MALEWVHWISWWFGVACGANFMLLVAVLAYKWPRKKNQPPPCRKANK